MTLKRRARLVCLTDAKPSTKQHTRPCGDCPWRRDALAGWLGGFTPESWIATAHGDQRVMCHTKKGPQCAGAAIYRANVCKVSRDDGALRLKADRKKVFSTPSEFLEYHDL